MSALETISLYPITLVIPVNLCIGALGLKAAKVGAVGAGVVGAIALKSKAG